MDQRKIREHFCHGGQRGLLAGLHLCLPVFREEYLAFWSGVFARALAACPRNEDSVNLLSEEFPLQGRSEINVSDGIWLKQLSVMF